MVGKLLKGWDDPRWFQSQYMNQPPRESNDIRITFYGKPVLLQRYREITGEEIFRLSVWMEGEEGRTRPLVEERWTYDDFHAAAYETARTASSGYLYPPSRSGGGVTETFMVEWAKKNWREVEKAEAKRYNRMDMGPWTAGEIDEKTDIQTTRFTGEDGRTYEYLDPRGDGDIDPVLLNATMNRDAILKKQEEDRQREIDRKAREKEAAELRALVAEQVRIRTQDELEAQEGWGAF